jgi:hypothetical protein
MVMSVTVGMNEAEGANRAPMPTLRLFLAWASGVLMILVAFAIASSVMWGWPSKPLQEKVFPSKIVLAGEPISWSANATILRKDLGNLQTVSQSLAGKTINDDQVRALFGNLAVDEVLVNKAFANNGKTTAFKFSVVIGAYTFPLFQLTEEDADFAQVKDALASSQ